MKKQKRNRRKAPNAPKGAKNKKSNRRSRAKYPNLNPRYNLKIRADLFDCDYAHKLNDEEKAYLDQFNSEYVNASFKKEDKPRKGKRRKLKNLHKTSKLRKACYKANNDRNVDIYAKAKAGGTLFNIEDQFRNEEDLHEKLEELNEYGFQGKDPKKDPST